MLPKVYDWLTDAGVLSSSYSNFIKGIRARWQGDPRKFSGTLRPSPEAGVGFWICESGGVHESWYATFACASAGQVATTMVVVGDLEPNPLESHCGCSGGPGAGWGGRILGKIPVEGSEGQAVS